MSDEQWQVIHGDALAVLKTMESNSVDAVVTDPPYDLLSGKGGFMGMKWDATGIAFNPLLWQEVLRVAKPGAHVLSFGGTRTQHRMVCAIEDAGWIVRDMIQWLYSTGFPKSTDVSKAIDRMLGREREVIGQWTPTGTARPDGDGKGYRGKGTTAALEDYNPRDVTVPITAPASDEAKQWEGWGSALKPAAEPICLARKPIAEGTVARQIMATGTGALNIDGTRVAGDIPKAGKGTGWAAQDAANAEAGYRPKAYYAEQDGVDYTPNAGGRWPANVVFTCCGLDPHADGCPVKELDRQSGISSSESCGAFRGMGGKNGRYGPIGIGDPRIPYGDVGGSSRFFYVTKPDQVERGMGLGGKKNIHATVKPLDLLRYLCRMITQPDGLVLDPFCGSGTTGMACMYEGFRFIGIDQDETYVDISKRRIAASVTARLTNHVPEKITPGQMSLFD